MARISIDIATGKLKPQNIIVGIDLGTTNSLIARVEDGKPHTIADYNRDPVMPSVVYYGNGNIIVGEDAVQLLSTEPDRTVYSVKRLIGKSYTDVMDLVPRLGYKLSERHPEGPVRIAIDGKELTPIEVSAQILKELKSRAEHKLKADITQVVITVPAYFDDTQRQATRDAGKLAGLDVLRIINEPTAASLAYGLGISPDDTRTVAVYDFGGGTFDVTILRIESGIFEVLSTNGDTYLGGDDMDHAIVEHWLNTYALPQEAAPSLRVYAKNAKHCLTTETDYSQPFTFNDQAINLTLTLQAFNALIEPLIKRTLACCKQALKDAPDPNNPANSAPSFEYGFSSIPTGIKPQDIDDVVLVGGCTRIPFVKEQVASFFGRKPHDELNPDEVVALGAAIQADILAGNRKDMLLLDVTPLSLGIETGGGLMDVLIPRNTKIPTRAARQYTTSVDGQINIRIAVYQGERERVDDNRQLACFDLRGIPAMPAGLPKVEVAFLLDADGILHVQAKELRSGIQQEISIEPKYGLTDAEVEKMLMDSLHNAKDDIDARLIVEAKEEARQVLYHTQKFITKNAALLTPEQLKETQNKITAVEQALNSSNKAAIQTALDELEKYTRPFAEAAMDSAIKDALTGTKIA